MLSIKPRQRAGEKGVMFKLVKSSSSEVHCETLFQKIGVDLKCQKRCVSVSGEPVHKEQESVSCMKPRLIKDVRAPFKLALLNLMPLDKD